MANFSELLECRNKTVSNCSDHDGLHRALLAGNCAIFAVGLSLNATALVIFARFFRPSGNPAVVYLANLAACDLLFTLALPLRIYYYATHRWVLGDLPCQLAGSLFQLNLCGSCLFLACVNVDRLLALAFPLRARHLRRPRAAWLVCAAVWALILLGSVPVALAHDTSCCWDTNGIAEVRCFESFSQRAWERELKPLVLLQFTLGFVPPLGVVLYCSGRVLYQLCRSSEAAGRRRKAIRLLAVNATIFVACFLPYNVILVVYTFLKTEEKGVEWEQVRLALQASMLLTSANCCLDPLVYYFSAEGFRNTLRARRPAPSPKTSWVSAKSRAGRRAKGAGGESEAEALRRGPQGAGDGAPGKDGPGCETPM